MKNDKKIKILLIDDDEMMRIYFRDIFWVHGRNDVYDVSVAASVQEAEKILSNKDLKPDVIFLDVMMPVVGGDNSSNRKIERFLSFVKELKENKDLSSTKIVIYSGQKEKAIEDEAKKLGVDGYLIKGELMPKEIIDFTDKIHESNN